ncbi:TIGR02466 family protein [Nonomuraea sp. NPDC046802]|uniref:TIGR02466 family protein n=1 Tax=Nonomuraea sp. NPDC046802 TaxID=3154919 RepID=UPI0034094F30
MTAMPDAEQAPDETIRCTGGIAHIFATPIGRLTHPYADQLNPQLATTILNRLDPDDDRFAYKRETSPDLAHWGDPIIDSLSRWVLKAARRFVEDITGRTLADPGTHTPGPADTHDLAVAIGNSWASVYRRGDHHAAHFHPNTALAAIYYVKAPGLCELDLMDPRPNIDYFDAGISLAGEDRNVRMHCRPGDLILIPGWLKHAVPAFEEPSERISISWNLGYTAQGSGQNRR